MGYAFNWYIERNSMQCHPCPTCHTHPSPHIATMLLLKCGLHVYCFDIVPWHHIERYLELYLYPLSPQEYTHHIMFHEITKIVLVLSLCTTWIAAGIVFCPTNQVAIYSSSLTCREMSCRSRVEAGVKCSTVGCRGIWFTDDGGGDIRCGLCTCASDFTHNILSLENITLAVNSPLSLPASKNPKPSFIGLILGLVQPMRDALIGCVQAMNHLWLRSKTRPSKSHIIRYMYIFEESFSILIISRYY